MCLLVSRIDSVSEHPVLVQAGKVHGDKMASVEFIQIGQQEEEGVGGHLSFLSCSPENLLQIIFLTVQSALSDGSDHDSCLRATRLWKSYI